MRNKRLRFRQIALLAALPLVLISLDAYAGGPLYLSATNTAVRWPVGPNFTGPVHGGPLNSQTVDQNGTVLYRVDSGTLGPLAHADAVAIVDRIFGLYNAIPTSAIRFQNAGPILDPATGNPMDVNGTNMGKVLQSATFQNPIIFDSDGSIIGDDLVLGEFAALQFDDPNNPHFVQEGFVMLNGQSLTKGVVDETSFIGVFTHEFGHLTGPLDHEQINGDVASGGEGFTRQSPNPALLPAGFSDGAAYDLFAPFTETLFPLLYFAPSGSSLGSQFHTSGFFVANLDLDTQNAISALYPNPDFLNSRGSIQGRVLVRTADGDVPIDNVNVVTRRISEGPYPPPLGTVAYPSAPSVDSFGIPSRPPAQASTDSLATVSSGVTGIDFGTGTYRVQGLPPGQYLVGFQQINPDFALLPSQFGGSSIGQGLRQLALPIPYQYYNGPDSSSTSPGVFVPVTVSAGQNTAGIDLIVGGLNTSNLTPIAANGNNLRVKSAQAVTFPSEVTGTVSINDPGQLRFIFDSQGNLEFITNLYKFTVTDTRIFFVTLDGVSGTPDADIDLFLWDSGVNKKKTNLNDSHLISLSAGPTLSEVVAVTLPPGTYIVGVGAASGTESYKLRIIPAQ